MENNLEKFIRQARGVKLLPEEKYASKRQLLNFISRNPVIPQVQARPGVWSRILLTRLNFASAMAILLVFVLLAGGGAAVGAEKSLPGDILYPVKVGISEEVMGWFAVTDEAKADWEVTRAERRLEEAEQLASAGELNTEARASIESNFEIHSAKVKDRIDKFENKEDFNSAAEVGSNFETALIAHEKILSKLFEEETDNKVKKEIKPIGVRVNSEVKTVKKTREKNEDKVSGKMMANIEASARGKLKAAEKKLAEVNKYMASTNFDADTKLEAEAKLEAAQTTIDYGKAKLEARSYGDAFTAFQKSLRIAQEAKLLIVARENLKVDVRIGDPVGGDEHPDNFSDENDEHDGRDVKVQIEGRLKISPGL